MSSAARVAFPSTFRGTRVTVPGPHSTLSNGDFASPDIPTWGFSPQMGMAWGNHPHSQNIVIQGIATQNPQMGKNRIFLPIPSPE